VPDQQTTVGETAAVAAVVQSLVARLAARHDEGEPPPVHATWRIEENRWSACRHGLAGTLADLDTGAPRPARECLGELIASLEPTAARLGCSEELAAAQRLSEAIGAERQRAVAIDGGVRGLAAWLAGRFGA
jgi:carboxylate-amine ligase